RIWRQAVPRRDADVYAIATVSEVLSPLVVNDVHLNRRVERIDAYLAVAAQDDRADVARRDLVDADDIHKRRDQFVAGIFHLHTVNLGRIEQTLCVFGRAKNGRSLRLAVTANTFEDRGTVVHDVGHDVNRGVVPVDELAVV